MAIMDMEDAIRTECTSVTEGINKIGAALSGLASVTEDDVKYIPLEDFMTEKLLAEAQSDFDSSELVFEYEL